jgi:hypothetical protein
MNKYDFATEYYISKIKTADYWLSKYPHSIKHLKRKSKCIQALKKLA